MSLGQLTANYTDSEGEASEDERQPPKVENKNPTGAVDSPSEVPPKKINRLVSYYNEDDEDETLDLQDEEPDEILNPEPMDTGTDDGEGDDDKSSEKNSYGITLPPPPAQKCSQKLQDKITKIVNDVRRGNKDYNVIIQNKKEFRNPSIYEKLVDLLQLDEMGSNYPLEMFDAYCWDKESYYDNLARVQKEEMDKREKERKEKIKSELIAGAKKPLEEEAKKRKSRFDQIVPTNTIPASVALPTLTTIPTGKKTTIEAFGSLKKK